MKRNVATLLLVALLVLGLTEKHVVFAQDSSSVADPSSTAPSTTTDPPVVTPEPTPEPTPSPPTGPVVTPKPFTAEKHNSVCDIILSRCECYVGSPQELELRKVIVGLLGISSDRLVFEERKGGTRGKLFGVNTRLRTSIEPRNVEDPAAGNQPTASAARDELVRLAAVADLTNLHVVSIETVPDEPKLYVFKRYTAWDILYTLFSIAGGIGFIGTVCFLVFKFWRQYKLQEEEAAEAEDDDREAAAKHGKNEKGAKGVDDDEEHEDDEEELMAFDRTDVDEEGIAALEKVVDVIARARAAGGGNWSEGALSVPTLGTEYDGVSTAASTRVKFSDAGNPVDGDVERNLFDTQSLPASVANSAAVRFATSLDLPPMHQPMNFGATPNATGGGGANNQLSIMAAPQQGMKGLQRPTAQEAVESMALPPPTPPQGASSRTVVDDNDL